MAEARFWLAPAAAIVLAVTCLRIVMLAFNSTDLFVDEAQYWLWGQELAFGYYSKPPMIGWVIRAMTELAGSDAPFWVRLPAPLFHATTSMILGAIAARLYGHKAAVITAAGFVTLPMVALGSLLISTDTIMFPFLSAALAGYLACLSGAGPRTALLTGVALGLAFLSKYAAVYYILSALLCLLLIRGERLSMRQAGLIGLAFLITISPNIIWNLLNGLTTVEHTLDNADWVRDPSAKAALNFAGFTEFFAAQFAVFGPVLFGGLLWLGATFAGRTDTQRRLMLFSLPIVALVCVQALLSRAYANWAAAAYLAGAVLVLPWLAGRGRGWLIASFAVNGAFCLVLPLATTQADTLTLGRDNLLLERYVGRQDLSDAIIGAAAENGVGTIVAGDRDILADLFYTGRDSGLRFRALPVTGRAPHHYALKYPFDDFTDQPVLLIIAEGPWPDCDGLLDLGALAPKAGAFRNKPQHMYLVAGRCLAR